MSFCTFVTLSRESVVCLFHYSLSEKTVKDRSSRLPVREIVKLLLNFVRLLCFRIVFHGFVFPVEIRFTVLPIAFGVFLNSCTRFVVPSSEQESTYQFGFVMIGHFSAGFTAE